MPRRHSGVEDRGLLQPEEFDIDELDYLDPSNGHARTGSKDWSRNPRHRRRRWFCSKWFCWTLFLVIALLVVGAALNKGGKVKIPKLPGKLGSPGKPDKGAEVEKPKEPEGTAGGQTPEKVESSAEPDRVEATVSSGGAGEASTVVENVSASQASTTGAESVEATSTAVEDAKPTGTLVSNTKGKPQNGTSQGEWTKPKDFKIIGLLFYGRPDTVAILDCYLRKNLVKNGGWLDEVHFVMNTDKQDDIKWLDGLVEKVEEYKKVEVKVEKQTDGYNAAWGTCNKKDMYIKIDDDIVFFDDDAISNLVFSLVKHPEALSVVSTLINSPETGWLHYRLGALHAYLPERSRSKESLDDFESYGPTAWRASKLPYWDPETGGKMEFPVSGVRMGKEDGYVKLPEGDPGAPPFKGHRWLPLPEGDKDLWRTPSAQSEYNPDGKDWASWSLGAQAHYSFLQNLEDDKLRLYYFGSSLDRKHERIWNMAYERMNINFMAIWGKDVAENLPFESFDDELALSVQVPKKLHRPLIVNTRAIASHFHFRSQLEMYDTDLLDRYRAYANEKVCTKDNQISIPPGGS